MPKGHYFTFADRQIFHFPVQGPGLPARVGCGRKPKPRHAGGETPPLRTSRNNGVGAGVPDSPFPNISHSEEQSDEESREQNKQRNHTGSFASLRMTGGF